MGRPSATAFMQRHHGFMAPPGTMLLRPLGAGATFRAALVRHSDESRPLPATLAVAKRPIADLAGLPEGKRALEREWRILEALRHDSLPRPLFFGEDAAGPYLVETAAKGISLRSLGEQAARSLVAATWTRLALASSQALADLHEHRDHRGPLDFVHGDISPDNVFFDSQGGATFTDFAMSGFRDDPEPIFSRARGTLPYAPPELAREDATPSAGTDTYSLAAVLAWLLVPDLSEAASGAALLLEIGERGLQIDALNRRSDLPAAALRVLRHALAFSPRDRLASSRDLARELRAALLA